MIQFKSLIGTKQFYRSVLAVTVPVMVQNGISTFVSLLDNVMVGMVGTEQMSGVSIVNQLLFVYFLCIYGAVSGAGLFTAQFFGKGDQEGVRHTFRCKFIAAGILTAGAIVLFLTCGESLIGLYLHEGSETGNLELTMHYAKQYLAIALVGLLPNALTQVYAGTLRDTGRTVPPMSAGIVGVAVNLVLNYFLIFGKLGFPALGVEGAAIATVIARLAECATVVVWTHCHRAECPFAVGVYRSLRIPLPLVKRILLTGTPLLLNETCWAAGQAALLQCYSRRGLAVVSAMNISNTMLDTTSILYMSIGTAVSILVGQLLGAGRAEEARDHARKLITLAFAMGICAGTLIAVLTPVFPQFYNTTDEVRGLAMGLLFVTAAASPIHAFMNATYFTLRSGGKTVITFLFDSVYVWTVSVVVAFLLTRFTSLPVILIFAICQAVDLIKCVIGFVLVKRGVWVRNIVNETQEEATEAPRA